MSKREPDPANDGRTTLCAASDQRWWLELLSDEVRERLEASRVAALAR